MKENGKKVIEMEKERLPSMMGLFTKANGKIILCKVKEQRLGLMGKRYEGEWKEGEKDGQGTHTWSSGNVYEGEWKEGEKDGQGTHTWSSGNVYEGEWKGGEMWNGTFSDKDGNNIDFENGLQKQTDKKSLLYIQPTLFDVVDDQDTSED